MNRTKVKNISIATTYNTKCVYYGAFTISQFLKRNTTFHFSRVYGKDVKTISFSHTRKR